MFNPITAEMLAKEKIRSLREEAANNRLADQAMQGQGSGNEIERTQGRKMLGFWGRLLRTRAAKAESNLVEHPGMNDCS